MRFGLVICLLAASAWAQELPQTALRGFGPVSGQQSSVDLPGGAASVLRVTCADAPHAQLLAAKYHSDLALLPGVTRVGRAWQVAGQGWTAAARVGHEVVILAAADDRDLATLRGRHVADGAQFAAEVPVPMWLDRWDKYGFRFYYRPWERPRDQNDATYDTAAEFPWLAQQGHSGLVFWQEVNQVDTAEGLLNDVWWDWGLRAAREQMLPVGINISCSQPSWLLNRYRDQAIGKMPQYCGSFHSVADPGLGGMGVLSWNATTAADAEMALLQSTVKRYRDYPNITTWLEPHGELKHGAFDILLEHGPVADAGYRRYLRATYGDLATISRRWYGEPGRLPTWDDVRVPELASFLGWGPQAIDLSGAWRVAYPEADSPAAWSSAQFDDSAWPTVVAPGHDRTMFLPRKRALYRRTVAVPAAWRAAHAKRFLYLWDLNQDWGKPVAVWVNGRKVSETPVKHPVPHWVAADVTDVLRDGDNQITLSVPQGYLGYRVYLSGDAPLQYPALGPQRNAQWVDLVDWIGWSRVETCRRGMTMIRQADPNRQITLMAPDGYADGLKQLAVSLGGNFHNTGYMGGFYAEPLPMLMRGAGLPFSCEPGGPASDLPEFKKQLGLWLSEGIQGLDYFIHMGNVMWNQPMREHFEAQQNVIHLIGKFHQPAAQVALLMSARANALTEWPWGDDPSVNLGAGYWRWNVGAVLRSDYQRDAISESDLVPGGSAARYRVILDTNTTIMEPRLVDRVEAWVRAGGTFVTYAQTGRHTPTEPDSWPIARLTGYRVAAIDPVDASRRLAGIDGESILPAADWRDVPANGLSLAKVAPECRDLLRWADGSTAVGLRPMGRGFVVQVGCRFHGRSMFDRVEPGGNSPEMQRLARLMGQLLAWRQVPRVPATVNAEEVLLRSWETNNGLYDVWTLWNQSGTRTVTTDLTFRDRRAPTTLINVRDGQPASATGITLAPYDAVVLLSPKGQLPRAGLRWLELQRSWWRAPVIPANTPPLPEPTARFAHDLSQDWSIRAMAGDEDAAPMAKTEVDDKAWPHDRLGVWTWPGRAGVKRVLFRRRFTVPAAWRDGEVRLWLRSFFNTTFVDQGRIWLDGTLLQDWRADGLQGDDCGGRLTAGSTHTLAVEARCAGAVGGPRGTCWLAFIPKPESTLDLAGAWEPSPDGLSREAPRPLPGAWSGTMARRQVTVPESWRGKRVMLDVDAPTSLLGVIVNGTFVRRHHHLFGPRMMLEIGGWLRYDGPNELELVRSGPGAGEVRSLRLTTYAPGTYP
ncbi:MAG: beta-galactosidase trimerization domain-containing protein [Armatimonadetes bacterium]|nr:beta-galactosidase trimerization domain-containing protein [Armatimonadota bacterium]